ncbi:hypothetical protein PF002_g4665 [Phytophthora fragariae]|uniref:Uncharacterized protein n=1 Tax=Phytophthora fragariae TaxID=53985 RepID=A0A6A3FGV9_9STRA|nr:hypothetical protein PF003_g7271 [Phytophthora fragariae]KAE8944432.1 hypothetical protein PF009_g5886 [Phytophthora fragariae]KAE9019425.1 hypothetical protein PF011_g5835 [Phytophthora fragariae]KAE9128055.1 hypothetical protein PF007_g5398 [Phytophthora fragariae]KAE9151162.1 hypothetical protein PF006_g4529 [Phytophthora fragariae]
MLIINDRRKKNIFKLVKGEYVATEKTNDTYSKGNIALLLVHGVSLQICLVGVMVSDPGALKALG